MKNENNYPDNLSFFSRDLIRIKNNKNPDFLFDYVHPDLLLKIAQGVIRTKKIATRELTKRGLNRDGHFIGFEQEI